MEQILIAYYENNAKKLHKMVDRILFKFGGISYKDLDDFYSLANVVFVDVLRRYDGAQSFDGFLYACLCNKIKSEMSRRNREKRRADRLAVSLDAPIGDESGVKLGDLLIDSYDLESELFGEVNAMTDKLEKYLDMLSKRQREVLELLSYCYEAAEIQKALHISKREYGDAVAGIRTYEKIRILF